MNPDQFANRFVLIVDDEPAIRTVIRLHLEKSGIPAIVASSAAEALDVFERDSARVRLLITDIVMPQISGCELAYRMRQIRPDLPVLYMSGFSDRAPDDGIPCLPKPLDFPLLIETVRVLAGFTAWRAARL
ncbi:MAG TPA: response regulator [Bryobacteraceae bacterium]|nr:response regulator [Bryobacteraceae bacterium]